MTSAPTPPLRSVRRLMLVSGGVLLALLVGAFAVGELMGWPWLAEPLERRLSQRLDREVKLNANGTRSGLRIHLLGGVQVASDNLQVAGPSWNPGRPTLRASGVRMTLRYSDLWALHQGAPLRVKSLVAEQLNAALERRADGRTSWHFRDVADSSQATPGLVFDRLEVKRGEIGVLDDPLELDAFISFALLDASVNAAPAAAASAAAPGTGGLQAKASGRYRGNTLTATLQSNAPLAWISGSGASPAVDVRLQAHSGPARLSFVGQVRDLLGMQGLQGHYVIAGPSLAAVGKPLGLTLPTTAAFHAQGRLHQEEGRWTTEVEHLTLGKSELHGSFVYARRPGPPLLSGQLNGKSLAFQDLGPAVGAAPAGEPAVPRAGGKVLPDRRFDLPALRAMDADIAVNIDRVMLGAAFADAIAPLKGRLLLSDGVLRLQDLDARTAKGRINGSLSLDGRADIAQWQARLQWSGLTLEQWIRQPRSASGSPPFVTGRLGGQLELGGTGRSSAEMLASASGNALLYWTEGSLSHLIIEEAGLDLAQALGVLLRGDRTLPVTCGAADLRLSQGQVVPQVMLVDTSDSTIWVDGSLSLATERLALRLRVSPKDFSPLTLRTPVLVGGTLADPKLSLEAGPLARRVVPAALLALINPLAAILPLLDQGGDEDSKKTVAACQALMQRATQVAGPQLKSAKTVKSAKPIKPAL
nr:AsmA family protein [uncultured Roseateles sp.]